MTRQATLSIIVPETAKEMAVLLLGQLLIAINEKQLIVSKPEYQKVLDMIAAKAAVVISDAKTGL